MRISDWSSDVCSSDLVSKTPNAPAPLACGWRSGTFSRLKCAICSRKCTSWSRMGPSAPIVSELRSLGAGAPVLIVDPTRSEEHTSELQSLMRISYAVFCLKKKKNKDTYRENLNSNIIISHIQLQRNTTESR